MENIESVNRKSLTEIHSELKQNSWRDDPVEIDYDTWNELSDRGELVFKAYVGRKSGGADNRPRVMLHKLREDFHIYKVKAGDVSHWAGFGAVENAESVVREDLENISRRNQGTVIGDEIRVKVNKVGYNI